MLSCFSQELIDEDLITQVRIGSEISSRHRLTGSIVDFTEVTSVNVSESLVASLARKANEKPRVFVVPNSDVHGLVRLYATFNGLSGVRPPMLATTREDAFGCLHLPSVNFQPIDGGT